MDKEAVVHIHNRMLLSHRKECIWISSNEVNEPGAGALLVVTEAMAHLFPHVSLAHLHYLPKLLYWGVITYHKSHPSLPGQWLLANSHSGATTTTVQLWNPASTTKRVRVPIRSWSPRGPARPGTLSSNFCLCRFALCGYFISTDSCRKWPFVSGFFHLAQCFGGSPMWQQEAEVHHFSSIYAIPLNGYRILCLPLSSWQTFSLVHLLEITDSAAVKDMQGQVFLWTWVSFLISPQFHFLFCMVQRLDSSVSVG